MPPSEAGRFALGAAYTVGGRFFNRIVGLASTLVLARILTPDDYGVVAIGVLVLNFCQNLTDTGRGQYIIRSDAVSDELVNTAWTLDLLVSTAVSLCFIILSGPIAGFFHMEHAQPVIATMSMVLIVGALSNPGVALLQRDQRYEKIFRAGLLTKSITAVAVVFTAYQTRSYWALVLGQLLSSLLGCIASYWIHPHRPRFCWINVTEQWRFSKWLLFGSVFGFTRSQFDTTMVGRAYEASEVGAYHNMKYLSTLAATQVVLPALSPLLATISRSRGSAEEFRHQIETVFLGIASSIGALSLVLYLLAPQVVLILLGHQWVEYASLFSLLALLSFPICYMRLCGLIVTAHGSTRVLFLYNVASLVLLAAALLSVIGEPVIDMALMRLRVDISLSGSFFVVVCWVFAGISPFRLLQLFALPGVSMAIAGGLTMYLLPFVPSMPLILLTALAVSLYCICYLSVLLLLSRGVFRRDPVVGHLLFIVRNGLKRTLARLR